MKMMPPDVISHENQLQHLSEASIFMLDVFRTADHAGQIFIPHRPWPDLTTTLVILQTISIILFNPFLSLLVTIYPLNLLPAVFFGNFPYTV